jgi:hypothetical protein
MSIQVGKSNYAPKSSLFEKTTYYKLGHKSPTERVLVMRIAPAIKDLSECGEWSLFYKTHFGYSLPFDRKDGTRSSFPATFLCVEKTDRDGTVRVACPECEEARQLKDKLEKRCEQLKNDGKTPDEIETSTLAYRKWLKDHNRDGKWHLLAKNLDGKWGILMINNKCKKRLEISIKKLLERNIDPLDADKGVWFRFYREGTKFNEIEDYVEVVTEEQTDGSTRLKYDAFTSADLTALEKLPSLSEVGRRLDAEQIGQIVSSGGSEAVLRTVMSIPTRSAQQQQQADTEVERAPVARPQPVQAQAPVAAAPEDAPEPEGQDPEIAAAMAALEKAKAAAAAKKAAATAKVAGPQVTAPPATAPAAAKAGVPVAATADMTMDQFLSMFESK